MTEEWQSRCQASITYISHEDQVPRELVIAKRTNFAKLQKEIPEMAEFLENMLGPSWTLATSCTLQHGHEGPHAFTLTWVDPTRRK